MKSKNSWLTYETTRGKNIYKETKNVFGLISDEMAKVHSFLKQCFAKFSLDTI